MTLITPGWASAAACMASPRSATTRTPSSNPSAPLAARALYSPTECPATPVGSMPEPLDGVEHHEAEGEGRQLGVAGLGQLVERGVEQQVGDVPTGRLGRVVDHLPRGWAVQGRPIPGRWAPWPGNTKAGTVWGTSWGSIRQLGWNELCRFGLTIGGCQ